MMFLLFKQNMLQRMFAASAQDAERITLRPFM